MGQRPNNFHKFDDKAAETTLLSIRMGNYAEVAAAAAGVKPDTFRKWLRHGRLMMRRAARCEKLLAAPPESLTAKQRGYLDEHGHPTELDRKLAKFVDDHDKALAHAHVMAVADIKAAGRSDWRAAAFRLERMFPDQWGRREKIEHTGAGGAALVPAAATLYLPPNGRDVDEDGAPAKVTRKQPPPVVDPPPPAPPGAEGGDDAVSAPVDRGGREPDPE